MKYINDFDTLYRLVDDYLSYVLEIKEELNIYIKSIFNENVNECLKYKKFKCKLEELKKYSEESKNVDIKNILKVILIMIDLKILKKKITKRYYKEKDVPTDLIFYII